MYKILGSVFFVEKNNRCGTFRTNRKKSIHMQAWQYRLAQQAAIIERRPPRIVFSAHGDTCFDESTCRLVPGSDDALFFGQVCRVTNFFLLLPANVIIFPLPQMDNFAGVNAMLGAYFSGRLPLTGTSCQITHGEESGKFEGAREIMKTLQVFNEPGCATFVCFMRTSH
jgi:hypothetical protein